jgi:hypothetical protein
MSDRLRVEQVIDIRGMRRQQFVDARVRIAAPQQRPFRTKRVATLVVLQRATPDRNLVS